MGCLRRLGKETNDKDELREGNVESRKGGCSPKPAARAELPLFAIGFVFKFGRTASAFVERGRVGGGMRWLRGHALSFLAVTGLRVRNCSDRL